MIGRRIPKRISRATPSLKEVTKKRGKSGRVLEVVSTLVKHKPLGTVGGVFVLLLILAAIFAPFLTTYDYKTMSATEILQSPSLKHLAGTDMMGRDMLTRILFGARVSLYVGLGATIISTIGAALIGIITGYIGGKLDFVVQRFIDAWMSFPWLIMVTAIMSIIGPGLTNVTIVLGVLMIAGQSRVIRGAVLTAKENVYIDAARAVGCGVPRIMLIHILPNVVAPIIIIATLALGNAILVESSLSFLGYGVPPPYPAWGSMLSQDGRRFMIAAPWLALFPGLAISLGVFGFNMLGDALRDILDPRLKGT